MIEEGRTSSRREELKDVTPQHVRDAKRQFCKAPAVDIDAARACVSKLASQLTPDQLAKDPALKEMMAEHAETVRKYAAKMKTVAASAYDSTDAEDDIPEDPVADQPEDQLEDPVDDQLEDPVEDPLSKYGGAEAVLDDLFKTPLTPDLIFDLTKGADPKDLTVILKMRGAIMQSNHPTPSKSNVTYIEDLMLHHQYVRTCVLISPSNKGFHNTTIMWGKNPKTKTQTMRAIYGLKPEEVTRGGGTNFLLAEVKDTGVFLSSRTIRQKDSDRPALIDFVFDALPDDVKEARRGEFTKIASRKRVAGPVAERASKKGRVDPDPEPEAEPDHDSD